MTEATNSGSLIQTEEANCTVLSFSDEFGSSVKKYYQVFPGVFLVHLEVDRPHLFAGQKYPEKKFIEIGYCKEGCMELRDKHSQLSLVPGDITVHCRVPANGDIYFPLRRYQALSVIIDLDHAPQEVLSLLGDFELDFGKMMQKYHLQDRTVYILKQAAQIATLFEELYTSAGVVDIGYQKIKVVEVLLRIRDFCMEDEKRERRSVSIAQKSIAKEVHHYLVTHPRECITIASLSQMFSVSQTQLKEGFRAVYGQPIHAFACETKMRAAAQFLLETDISVTDTAERFGYANTGKFSTAFRRVMGKTPMQYRKQHRKQAN